MTSYIIDLTKTEQETTSKLAEPQSDHTEHNKADVSVAESSNSNVTFKCGKCKSLCSRIPYLNEHMREKHRIFNCKFCEFTSSSDVGLKIHTESRRFHRESHGFYCDYCRIMLGSEDHFLDHMRAHIENLN